MPSLIFNQSGYLTAQLALLRVSRIGAAGNDVQRSDISNNQARGCTGRFHQGRRASREGAERPVTGGRSLNVHRMSNNCSGGRVDIERDLIDSGGIGDIDVVDNGLNIIANGVPSSKGKGAACENEDDQSDQHNFESAYHGFSPCVAGINRFRVNQRTEVFWCQEDPGRSKSPNNNKSLTYILSQAKSTQRDAL
jgi:hypothetical protein